MTPTEKLQERLKELKMPAEKFSEWLPLNDDLAIWQEREGLFKLYSMDGFHEICKFEKKDGQIIIDAMARNIRSARDFPKLTNEHEFILSIEDDYLTFDIPKIQDLLTEKFESSESTIGYLSVPEKEVLQIFKCSVSDFVSTELSDFEEVKIMNQINPLEQDENRRHFFLVSKEVAEELREDQ